MKRRIIAIVAAILCLGLLGTGLAMANTASGPGPIITSPGPYFQQGDTVNECVNLATRAFYIETQTVQLGNCASGYTQLSILAQPNGDSDPFIAPTFYVNSAATNPNNVHSGLAFTITDQATAIPNVTPGTVYDCFFTVPTQANSSSPFVPGVTCTKAT